MKPSTTARGYGWHHQKLRKRLEPKVRAGKCLCERCGKPILPGQLWDLDHTDDRTGYLGPSHRQCNRRKTRRRQSRDW